MVFSIKGVLLPQKWRDFTLGRFTPSPYTILGVKKHLGQFQKFRGVEKHLRCNGSKLTLSEGA